MKRYFHECIKHGTKVLKREGISWHFVQGMNRWGVNILSQLFTKPKLQLLKTNICLKLSEYCTFTTVLFSALSFSVFCHMTQDWSRYFDRTCVLEAEFFSADMVICVNGNKHFIVNSYLQPESHRLWTSIIIKGILIRNDYWRYWTKLILLHNVW